MSGRKKDNIISGTQQGGLNAAQTNKKRHGEDFYRTIGAIGGKRGHTGGFASKIACNCPIIETDHYKAQCSGKKGGSASKRSRVK